MESNREERNEYLRETEARLELWKTKVHELRARAERQSGERRRAMQDKAVALEEQLDDVHERLQALAKASEGGWPRARGEVDALWVELRKSAAHVADASRA